MTGEVISFVDPVSVDLSLTGSGSSVIAEGTVTGRLRLRCVRCLELFDHEINAPFRETYTRLTTEGLDEEILYSGDNINLEPEVLKVIILSLPMKPVCREDCRGLCPHCGCNLNISRCGCTGEDTDPRFDALRDLFK